MKRRRHKTNVRVLMLTPMLDMFTVILVFLIVSFSPDESRLQKSADVRLPKAHTKLRSIPKIQIEIAETYVKVNGKLVPGLSPSQKEAAAWSPFQAELAAFENKNQPVLVISDEKTSYQWIDQTVARLANYGFHEVFFLTERGKETLQ